jgi:hypothetical protein
LEELLNKLDYGFFGKYLFWKFGKKLVDSFWNNSIGVQHHQSVKRPGSKEIKAMVCENQ